VNDTKPDVEERLRALYAARSVAERVEMATSMFGSAKQVARAGIRMELGDIPESEMRRLLFLRFYGDDFSDVQTAAILRVIRGAQ
jgi:hypothetical protein